MTVLIRPFTTEEFKGMFGHEPEPGLRGVSVLWSGKLAALVVLLEYNDHLRIACDVLPWVWRKKKAVLFWRVAAHVVTWACSYGKPVYAWAEEDGKLLKSLGFVHLRENIWGHSGF